MRGQDAISTGVLYSGTSAASFTGQSIVKLMRSMEEAFYFALPLDKEAHKAAFWIENYLSDIKNPMADTFDFDCAIIIFPTTSQIEYFRAVLDKDFNDTMAQITKYYATVRRLIESNRVIVVSVTNEYLELVGRSQTWNLTLRKENLPAWNLIFFKTDKEPAIVPPAGFGDKLTTEYFNVSK